MTARSLRELTYQHRLPPCSGLSAIRVLTSRTLIRIRCTTRCMVKAEEVYQNFNPMYGESRYSHSSSRRRYSSSSSKAHSERHYWRYHPRSAAPRCIAFRMVDVTTTILRVYLFLLSSRRIGTSLIRPHTHIFVQFRKTVMVSSLLSSSCHRSILR